MKVRKECDTLGCVDVPSKAYYGVFTVRAISNFPPFRKIHKELRDAFADVKWSCASMNAELSLISGEKAAAIEKACDEIKGGMLDQWLVVDPLSGGAGTAVNMNFNEVIANRASQILGGDLGSYVIRPIEDVNLSQSTNDTYPTAVKLGAIRLLRRLVNKVVELQGILQEKEKEYAGILKVGRTELQDALPMTLGQEFGAWAEAIARDRWRLYKVEERIRFVNLGGTAIGTGFNAPKNYASMVTRRLSERTGVGLVKSENLIDATQNADVFSEVHGLLKTLATNVIKISNDLRFLSSGPQAGIGELKLRAVQPGSSIMPAKVNPVLLEYAIQMATIVVSNDVAVNFAVSSGNLELNAFLPLIQNAVYESFDALMLAVDSLKRCVQRLEANRERCEENLRKSKTFLTSLVPVLGYEKVARIIEESEKNSISLEEVLRSQGIPDDLIRQALDVKNMVGLGFLIKKER